MHVYDFVVTFLVLYSRLNLVFLLMTERDIFDCHKFVVGMKQPKTKEELDLVLVIKFTYLKLVVDLVVVLYSLY